MLPTSSGEANGQGRFQERAFYKALTPRPTAGLVKKFVKTQLFPFHPGSQKSKNLLQGMQKASYQLLPSQGVVLGGEGRALLRGSQKTADPSKISWKKV